MSVDRKDFEAEPSGVEDAPESEGQAPRRRKRTGLRVPSDNVPRPEGQRTSARISAQAPVVDESGLPVLPPLVMPPPGPPAAALGAVVPPPGADELGADGLDAEVPTGQYRAGTEDLEVDVEVDVEVTPPPRRVPGRSAPPPSVSSPLPAEISDGVPVAAEAEPTMWTPPPVEEPSSTLAAAAGDLEASAAPSAAAALGGHAHVDMPVDIDEVPDDDRGERTLLAAVPPPSTWVSGPALAGPDTLPGAAGDAAASAAPPTTLEAAPSPTSETTAEGPDEPSLGRDLHPSAVAMASPTPRPPRAASEPARARPARADTQIEEAFELSPAELEEVESGPTSGVQAISVPPATLPPSPPSPPGAGSATNGHGAPSPPVLSPSAAAAGHAAASVPPGGSSVPAHAMPPVPPVPSVPAASSPAGSPPAPSAHPPAAPPPPSPVAAAPPPVPTAGAPQVAAPASPASAPPPPPTLGAGPPPAPTTAAPSVAAPPPTPVSAPPMRQAAPPPPPPAKAAPPPAPVAASAAAAAAAGARAKKRKGKAWFEEIFDEDYLRTLPFLTPQATQREASFVADSLALRPGHQVLDLGCGYGRHAMELAARGYHVVGLDLSLPLLIRGADEAQRRGLNINFVHGDMRELTFDAQFDGAYCVFSTFGYFDDETNKRVAQNLCRALKPGGRLVLDVLNRDYVIGDLPTRVWWEGDGCVVLEEVDFNYFSSRVISNRSVVFEDGRQLEQEITMRAYSLHELGKLLHSAGFRVIEVSGGLATRGRFFGHDSKQIIVVAEKRADGGPLTHTSPPPLDKTNPG
jgi:SAM-dependent methyltransferase